LSIYFSRGTDAAGYIRSDVSAMLKLAAKSVQGCTLLARQRSRCVVYFQKVYLTELGVSNYTNHDMTIAGRNRILIFGICITALMVIGSISCCIVIVAHNLLAKLPTVSESTFQLFRLPFFAYNNYAAMIGIAAFPLIALALLVCIFFLFEKTHALEISFFGLFIFALSVEALQLLFPLQERYPLLTVFMASVARIIFFFRFGACLALLTSSLFAHKTFTRETGSIIFLLSFIAFALSHVIPIDTIQVVSFFSFSRSYRYLLYSFSGIVCVLAVVSFLLVGIYRSITEYRKAAIQLLIMLIAYTLLLYTGSWFFTVFGIVALLVGGGFFLKAIHQFYLWQ